MLQVTDFLSTLRDALAPLQYMIVQYIPTEWVGSVPVLILILFGILALIVGMKFNPLPVSFVGLIVTTMTLIVLDPDVYGSSFGGVFARDVFADFFIAIIMIVAFLVLMSSTIYGGDKGIYNFMLMISFAGAIWVVMATDLIALFLAWEMMSTPTYILAALGPHRKSVDGATKYFIMGLLSTTFLLFGIALIYGVADGATSLSTIGSVIEGIWNTNGQAPAEAYTVLLAMILLVIAFGFKIGIFPGWMWVPDTYSTADGSVTSYLAGATKKTGVSALLRIIMIGLFAARLEWMGLLVAVSILTMIIGNVLALAERNLMRMLAFSSIAMMGYILIGIAVGTELGTAAALFHAFTHALMKVGAFIVVWMLSYRLSEVLKYEDIAGLSQRAPFAAISLGVFVLALAGLPLTVGFWSKLVLFQSAVEVGLWWLALIGLLNSVFSLGYYLRVLRYMFMMEPTEDTKIPLQKIPAVAVLLCLIGVIALFVFPGIVLDYAFSAASTLFAP